LKSVLVKLLGVIIIKAGEDFEQTIKTLFVKMGFEAILTKSSGDGGIDVIVLNNEPMTKGKYVIQCKDWTASVGEAPVRDLLGVVHSEGANKGILITTSAFTTSAKRFAEGKPIELIDGIQLNCLLEEYGLINDDINDFEDEDAKKYEEGLCRLIKYNTNNTDHHFIEDYNNAINQFGSINIGIGTFNYRYKVNNFDNYIGFNNVIFREADFDHMPPGIHVRPGNALFSVKFEVKDIKEWYYFAFECSGKTASSLIQQVKVGERNSKACYIATEIYQNIDSQELFILRNWRDNILKNQLLGRAFINIYYKYSDRLLLYIGNKQLLRKFIKNILDIFVYFLMKSK